MQPIDHLYEEKHSRMQVLPEWHYLSQITSEPGRSVDNRWDSFLGGVAGIASDTWLFLVF